MPCSCAPTPYPALQTHTHPHTATHPRTPRRGALAQLCINYANEVLQNQFNADVFKQQQREYEAEGVPWQHVDYQASRYMTVT